MHRNPLIHAYAASMRAAPTTTEALLWGALRGSNLGVGFRRQLPIGRYIADFAAPSARLVVEVDGGYHAGRVKADARRDRELGRLGWRVLRLEAVMVQHRVGDAPPGESDVVFETAQDVPGHIAGVRLLFTGP